MAGNELPISVVIISGYSGAGKTVALRAFEDIGYFCIDNLPVALIASFLATASEAYFGGRIGIGVDIREKALLSDAERQIAELRRRLPIEIVFLEAEPEVLICRFKETRRPHPLMNNTELADLSMAIEKEGNQLSALRDAADKIIDTSSYSPHQLRQLIISYYGKDAVDRKMSITVMSFGFKYGTPPGLDLLFDVRFLPNPYFIPELKALTGLNREVIDFVMGQADTSAFLGHSLPMLDFLIPRYIREGKSYLTIGVGCTGGRHRSPVIAGRVASHLESTQTLGVNVHHRDLETRCS